MSTIDERVAYLEGTVAEHTRGFSELRDMVQHLDGKVDRRLDALDLRFDATDRRFEAIDRRFEVIDRRFEAIDRRFEAIDLRFDAIDRRFEGFDQRLARLDDKMSRQFLWLMGVQVAVLIAVISALAGA